MGEEAHMFVLTLKFIY